METTLIKLIVTVVPLLTFIIKLSKHGSLRRAQVLIRGRRTRDAVARALAAGVMCR